MSKKDYYIVEKNTNKIYHDEHTNFLDILTLNKVRYKLKNINYNIFIPYPDSEKNIIYTNNKPKIRLLELITNEKLTHREILGSLFGLNIDDSTFGDIIITNNYYYIIILDSIYHLIMNEYHMVASHYIKLKEVSLDILNDYHRSYETIELITSSMRIDNIISKLIGISRDSIKEKFYNEEIIINYEPCHKINYLLKENDIFSIRKYGKYRYIGIIKNTKKGNFIIKINKYIDN